MNSKPPLDPVRMAWPFKTKKEQEILMKWYKEQTKKEKKRQYDEHVEIYGKAFL